LERHSNPDGVIEAIELGGKPGAVRWRLRKAQAPAPNRCSAVTGGRDFSYYVLCVS
jgi:hypothetical protein